uniref:Uncharacterized protein n=1 Tax=Anopheles epiroticus TaxID=199890 RepID=A0A182PWN0_9DIPT
PRTILRTQRNPPIPRDLGNGKFWYHGIRRCLTVELRKHKILPRNLLFDINIDGLPLHNRAKTQFWPILLRVVDQPY